MTGLSRHAARVAVAAAALAVAAAVPLQTVNAGSPAAWTQASPAIPANTVQSMLNGIACSSASACVAGGWDVPTGASEQPLIESWDGTAWTVATTPALSGSQAAAVDSVACAGAAFCVAAGWENAAATGRDQPLVEMWNGSTWSLATTPAFAASSDLNGVSCTSASNCMAVGDTNNGTLAERWDGTLWTVTATPNPASLDRLNGISCAATTMCVAVGATSVSGGGATIVEQWNGSVWAVVPSVNPTANSGLDGVSCVAVNACTAVGVEGFPNTDNATLVEQWNGGSWSVVSSPNPGSTIDASFDGVSCVAATSCVAVGRYFVSSTGGYDSLIESWNGSAWTVVTSPNPTAANLFSAVSCAAATWCGAGGYTGTTDHTVPLVATGSVPNPTTTTLVASANPAVVGQPMTYTATVSPPPDGGTVTFSDGNAPISGCSGLATNPSSGTASCTTTYTTTANPSPAATHTITAAYSGDGTFSASSGQINEAVDAAPTSTTLSGASRSIVGQAVTFTAHVAMSNAGSATPGGTVAFSADGSGVAGCSAVALSSGSASCTTASLPVGTHSIVAAYSGDAATAASSSAPSAQTVGYAMALLYNSTTAVRSGSTLSVKVELEDAAGNDLSSSGIAVTAQCVVLQPSSSCSTPVRTLNQAFSFVAASRKGGPAAYNLSLNTRGLTRGSYDVVVSVAGDPTAHVAPFAIS